MHATQLTRLLGAPALLALAAHQGTGAPRERQLEITLSNFAFAPNDIRLEAGRRYRLHLVNGAKGGHNFAARDFFRAASVDPADRALIDADGAVEVPKGQARDIRLVPARGTYRVRCTHFLHTGLGMKGSITVE